MPRHLLQNRNVCRESSASDIFLNVMIWRHVLSFLNNFEELANKTRILFIRKICSNLKIEIGSDVEVYFKELIVPAELWKQPINIIEIGRYIVKRVIFILKNNKELQRKNRPLLIPRSPEFYYHNLEQVSDDMIIRMRKYKYDPTDNNILYEFMIFLHLLLLSKVKNSRVKLYIEHFISETKEETDIGPCITCSAITHPINYKYTKTTTYSVRLCKQCERILLIA
jgi:hypothetical protein